VIPLASSRPASAVTPLSVAELGIRLRSRERATARWLGAVVLGIVLVVAALAVGFTGWIALTIVGIYSAIALVLAVRSAILLAQLRS